MDKSEFLDLLLTPIAIFTEIRWITWPILLIATLWLVFRHFMNLKNGYRFSLALWWSLISLSLISMACVALLYLFSPPGSDFYRVAIGFIAAVPLVIPGIICFFIRPSR